MRLFDVPETAHDIFATNVSIWAVLTAGWTRLSCVKSSHMGRFDRTLISASEVVFHHTLDAAFSHDKLSEKIPRTNR